MDQHFRPCNHPTASRYIRSFWQMQGEPIYQTETILPKGVVELIFSFDEPLLFHPGQPTKHVPTPRCFINGINQEPVQLATPEKQFFFGIMLRPVAVKKLLKAPAGVFANAIINLEEVQKEFAELWHLLAEAADFKSRISMAENWINTRQKEINPQELAISDYLYDSLEASSVAGLAKQFCYSGRQLNRKSQEMFGMSTEAMLAYKRYLHSLRLIHQSNDSLTSIAYDCAYFDQAHLNHEFRQYTGLTPGEYRKQKSAMPGHLYQNVRYVQG